jgi:feruloyl esterase
MSPANSILVSLILATMASCGTQAADCERLLKMKLENTSIEKAAWVSPGPLTSAELPYSPWVSGSVEVPVAACRVQGSIKPAATSNIKFEVWLPREDWNGRYQQVGNGGLAGSMDIFSLHEDIPSVFNAIRLGYAAGVTDDGTAEPGDPAAWQRKWLTDPERVADYGHRAVHLTARNAKALIEAFYGTPAKYSYFMGASKGGQEAMSEAQRHPADFDGIVAEMPGMDYSRVMIGILWNSEAMLSAPHSSIPGNKLKLLNDAVIAACIDRAGIRGDNFLTDPRACTFDPAKLLCAKDDAPECLTQAQVAAARAIYRGPFDPRNGESIQPGQMLGSEAPDLQILPGFHVHGWLGYQGVWLNTFPIPIMANIFRQPTWNVGSFDYTKDVARVEQAFSSSVDATNPDLEAFRARGGKLIMTMGWNDPLVPAQGVVRYYERVLDHQQQTGRSADRAAALARTQSFFRLYMVPGQGHESWRGVGPVPRRKLDALVKWVEQGVGPATLPGEKYVNDDKASGVSISRPLCAYPQVARWNGVGSSREATNFNCE